MNVQSNLTDQELDSIMEKIQKLLRLRDNSGATVGEVANAGAMIQKLLLQYNLTMEAIEQHQPERKVADYTKSDKFDLGASSNYRTEWRAALLNKVARNNFCRVVVFARVKETKYTKGQDAKAVLVGKPYNVQITKELYEWLADQVNRLCTKGWTAYHASPSFSRSKKVWKTSFFRGAVEEIGNRLAEERRKAEAADGNVHALVLVSDKGLQTAYDHFFGLAINSIEYHWFRKGERPYTKYCSHMLKTGKPCRLEAGSYIHWRLARGRATETDQDAYEQGREAGRNVNLQPKRKLDGASKRREIE